MGSTLFIVVIISILQYWMVHGVVNVRDLDDLIRTYAARGGDNNNKTRRHNTGSLYDISLPTNLSSSSSDIKASAVTLRNSVLWRKGANFSGIRIPPRSKTTPYAKRIAFVYTSFGYDSSSVYFRLSDGYSFVSPVIGFSVYDATNTSDLKRLNLSVYRGNPILVSFDHYDVLEDRKRIKCVVFGDNGSSSLSNATGKEQCSSRSMSPHGHYYALVVLNRKPKPGTKPEPGLVWRKWWFVLGVFGVLVLVLLLMLLVVKLVRRKRLRERERESEKSEMIGNIWIGRSRMPAATMVRTQPCLEYHEDLPTSSSIP